MFFLNFHRSLTFGWALIAREFPHVPWIQAWILSLVVDPAKEGDGLSGTRELGRFYTTRTANDHSLGLEPALFRTFSLVDGWFAQIQIFQKITVRYAENSIEYQRRSSERRTVFPK
jgi:hypothetical protein